MNQDDIGSNRALSRGFLTEAPFLVGERHKVQGARHKAKRGYLLYVIRYTKKTVLNILAVLSNLSIPKR